MTKIAQVQIVRSACLTPVKCASRTTSKSVLRRGGKPARRESKLATTTESGGVVKVGWSASRTNAVKTRSVCPCAMEPIPANSTIKNASQTRGNFLVNFLLAWKTKEAVVYGNKRLKPSRAQHNITAITENASRFVVPRHLAKKSKLGAWTETTIRLAYVVRWAVCPGQKMPRAQQASSVFLH